MSDSSSVSSGGIGFFGLLTILFVGLKLTGYIDWSWWWVLAPIWGPIALVVGIVGIVFLVALLLSLGGQRNVSWNRSWTKGHFSFRSK